MQIGSAAWKKTIRDGAIALAVDIDAEKIDQFAVHAAELIQWNQKVNLTSITDPKAIALKHFLDSIAPGRLIPSGASVLDIGSGGGFPGIPLKVLRPDLSVTLIDAARKKVSFLKHVIRTLNLKDIWAHQVRAENLSRERKFDVIITRALTTLSEFVSLSLPVLDNHGVMLALKGGYREAQLEISGLLSDEVKTGGDRLTVTVSSYVLSGISVKRTIVAVKKTDS
jgi:16S rRNA (guanine527-N7)-methyltransferase